MFGINVLVSLHLSHMQIILNSTEIKIPLLWFSNRLKQKLLIKGSDFCVLFF